MTFIALVKSILQQTCKTVAQKALQPSQCDVSDLSMDRKANHEMSLFSVTGLVSSGFHSPEAEQPHPWLWGVNGDKGGGDISM